MQLSPEIRIPDNIAILETSVEVNLDIRPNGKFARDYVRGLLVNSRGKLVARRGNRHHQPRCPIFLVAVLHASGANCQDLMCVR